MGERLAAHEALPWSGKPVKELSPGEKKARSDFMDAFSALEFDLLAQMPLSALEKVDAKGKELSKGTRSFANNLVEDDVLLATLVRSLYQQRERPGLLETELGRTVVTLTQRKLAQNGVLRNQLRGTECSDWIASLPKSRSEK